MAPEQGWAKVVKKVAKVKLHILHLKYSLVSIKLLKNKKKA